MARISRKSLKSSPAKLPSMCQPSSPGSSGEGNRTGKVPRPPRGSQRSFADQLVIGRVEHRRIGRLAERRLLKSAEPDHRLGPGARDRPDRSRCPPRGWRGPGRPVRREKALSRRTKPSVMKASICAAESAGKVPGIWKIHEFARPHEAAGSSGEPLNECPERAPSGAEEHCELVRLDHHHGAANICGGADVSTRASPLPLGERSARSVG